MSSSWNFEVNEVVLAFRGYNVTNLGRTAELLACDAYSQIILEEFKLFSEICSQYTKESVDLTSFVTAGKEPGLARYA